MAEPAGDQPTSPLTVREARQRFFQMNGFGLDGGYDDEWAEAEFGPVVYRVPNIRSRARALRIHDLHHLATGYATDWRGEAEISAWELGSGWGRHPYAWIIALFGFMTGLLTQPRLTFAAFFRGRNSSNLYGRNDVVAELDRPLSALVKELHVPDGDSAPPPSAGDVVRLAATSAAALAFGVLSLPFVAFAVFLGEARRGLDPSGCPSSVLGTSG